MSLPAVRFQIPLGAGFSEKYHVSPFSILGHCFDVVSNSSLNRTEMAMCMISSKRQNGCRAVYSPWSMDGTEMNRSSDQGINLLDIRL